MTTADLDYLFTHSPEKAFEEIYDKHYQALCARSFRITHDTNSAQDVVQEVLLELWRKKADIKLESSVLAYLSKAVYYRSLNFIKNKAYQFDNEVVLLEMSSDQATVPERMAAAEVESRIGDLIAQLPPKCRAVFSLSRFEDKSYKEIAEELDISVKTVEHQIGKALKLLRDQLI